MDVTIRESMSWHTLSDDLRNIGVARLAHVSWPSIITGAIEVRLDSSAG